MLCVYVLYVLLLHVFVLCVNVMCISVICVTVMCFSVLCVTAVLSNLSELVPDTLLYNLQLFHYVSSWSTSFYGIHGLIYSGLAQYTYFSTHITNCSVG